MPARRACRWKTVLLGLASALLAAACASGPQHSRREDLRLDTETAARLRHAAAVGRGAGAAAVPAGRVVASQLAELVPFLLTVLEHHAVGELEDRLVECARLADRQVNAAYFGDRAPTRAECGEEVVVDGCVKPITRAMLLGQEKHALALECAREVLDELWPASFSIEQRYRYYPNADVVASVSREEEARLIAQGCTRELWRTIKPDIVLHPGRDLLRSMLTLELKFPCPETNAARWTEYGETSAYANSTQRDVYQKALVECPTSPWT